MLLPRILTSSLLLILSSASHILAQSTPPAWGGAVAITSSKFHYINAMVTDATGNTYTAASFTDPVTVAPGVVLTSQSGSDAYLAKYAPTGALLWVRQISGAGSQSAQDIALDAVGNPYLVGIFSTDVQLGTYSQSSAGGTSTYVAHLDAQGQPIWLQKLTDNAVASRIGLDAAGNLYLSGHYYYEATLGTLTLSSPTAISLFLAKYNKQGIVQWARQGGGIPFPSKNNSYFTSFLTVSPSGDAYLSWAIHSEAGGFGTLPLTATYGGTDVMVVRYDTQGTPQWQQRYGTNGEDYAGTTALDNNGHLLVCTNFAGNTPATVGALTLNGTGQTYGALLQLDAATGILNWARPLPTTGESHYNDVATDAAGNCYVAGQLTGSAIFDTQTLNSNAVSTDALVVSYSQVGASRWAQLSASSQTEMAHYIGSDGSGEISIGGYFDAQAQFGSKALTGPIGWSSSFIARLNSPLLTASQASRNQTLGFYPNPANDLLHLPTLPSGTLVRLFDALGRIARETTLSNDAIMSVRGIRPGLYTLRATSSQGQNLTSKIMVE